jgi:hypothetical protein
VVLNECEIWPLTIREECRLRAYEKWVLRNVFGFKRKNITGDSEKTAQ